MTERYSSLNKNKDVQMKTVSISVLLLVFTVLATFSAQAEEGPHYQHKKIALAGQTLDVEIADNQERWAYGLMYRTELKEGSGMLFIFPEQKTRSFWMKNTFVALAIGYFNSKKELIDIQEMAAAQSEMQTEFPNYVSKEAAQYALEVPKGWFQKHKGALKSRFVLQ
jgi:uncharacterized protein